MTRLAPDAVYVPPDPIKRRLIFEDNGWCIYKWDDREDYTWSCKYTMWHKCGAEQDHGVRKRDKDKHLCMRCDVGPPDGLVGLYEMLNWKEQGYGG